jgi:hypothetical protein
MGMPTCQDPLSGFCLQIGPQLTNNYSYIHDLSMTSGAVVKADQVGSALTINKKQNYPEKEKVELVLSPARPPLHHHRLGQGAPPTRGGHHGTPTYPRVPSSGKASGELRDKRAHKQCGFAGGHRRPPLLGPPSHGEARDGALVVLCHIPCPTRGGRSSGRLVPHPLPDT